MTNMTAQQYTAHLKTTRPYLLMAPSGRRAGGRMNTDTRWLPEPSWGLEVATFAFILLLAVFIFATV